MPLTEILTRARVVLVALPSRLAAIAAVLTVINTELVPLLPAPLAVKVAAGITSALAGIAVAVKVIARLTQVPDAAVGLVLPEGQQMRVELVGQPWPAGHDHDAPPGGYRTGGTIKGHSFSATNLPNDGIVEALRSHVRTDMGGDVRLHFG